MADALDELGASDPAPSRAVAEVARARGKADGLEADATPGRGRAGAGFGRPWSSSSAAPATAGGHARVRTLGLHSCPFDGLVTTHRDLTCGMNLAWAEGVLDGLGQADLAAHLDPADGFCCVAFDSPPAHRAPADAAHD